MSEHPGRSEHPRGQADRAVAAVGAVVEQSVNAVQHRAAAAKPHLRGWLHAGTFPAVVVAGTTLVVLAPTTSGRVTAAVFGVTAALLFGVSAVYHRGRWSPRVAIVLKRLDHASIFLIIAGTYTPFAVLLLPPGQAQVLLWIVWLGALGGVAFRVFWVGAPRWLYTPVYIALGWVAVAYIPGFLDGGGPGMVTLIAVGGLLYTVGGVVYATKRPNPSPRYFGFHEVFHALTIAAFAAHFVAASLAVHAAGGA